MITLKAFAKVNLGLDVLRRREDGYHDVSMIMQTVGIFDVITMEKRNDDNVTFVTDSQLLTDEDAETNLCVRAARAVMAECGCNGADIKLQKNIPIAAGMAGGSTDAAAVLKGMNQLYDLGLDDTKLKAIGVKLGADIPYCIQGGTALSEGIGEVLTALPSPPSCYVVLAKPAEGVSTGFVYKNLKLDDTTVHPDIPGLRSAIENQDYHKMCQVMDNLLATVTEPACPKIVEIKKRLTEFGADKALMSGSGPTVFALFTLEETAQQAAEILSREMPEIFVTATSFV